MKRIFSVLLAVAIILTIFPIGTFEIFASTQTSFSNKCGENLYWNLENGVLTIIGTGDMDNYNYYWSNYSDIILPPWYDYSDSIQSVVIGSGVTGIGNDAFREFENLASVTLGNDVKTIGDYAFSDCTALKYIEIPDSVTDINRAFYESGIVEITVPGTVKTIESWAFSSCNALSKITLSDGIEEMEQNAFEYCYNL